MVEVPSGFLKFASNSTPLISFVYPPFRGGKLCPNNIPDFRATSFNQSDGESDGCPNYPRPPPQFFEFPILPKVAKIIL
jgi:hypothetical protein